MYYQLLPQTEKSVLSFVVVIVVVADVQQILIIIKAS
jgi:hypothetical protein